MSSTPILVFDIETIPDLETGKRLYGIDSDNDDDALNALIALRQQETGQDFMRLPLHQVACLSFLWIDQEQMSLNSLCLENRSEKEILSGFLRAFTHPNTNQPRKPLLISWNGAEFDLPVLMYRMVRHGLNAHHFFKTDYLYRYSKNHIDVMKEFGFGSWRANQKLDTIACLCGYAGKGDTDGSDVVPMVKDGQWSRLKNYCESDVLNTWLIYLRHELLKSPNPERFEQYFHQTIAYLQTLKNPDGTPSHPRFDGLSFVN